jgi:hypothetical protein
MDPSYNIQNGAALGIAAGFPLMHQGHANVKFAGSSFAFQLLWDFKVSLRTPTWHMK